MLKIRFEPEWLENEPYVLVAGDRESHARARDFFAQRRGGYLNDSEIADFCDLGDLQPDRLMLTVEEGWEIAKLFNVLTKANVRCHHYFDTQRLGNIPIYISYGEIDHLFSP